MKLYISEKEDFSEDLLYADGTKLVSLFEESECEVETEGCELCLLENLQNQKAIECLKELKEKLKTHCGYYFSIDDADGWYLSEAKIDLLIDNKIKELEKN